LRLLGRGFYVVDGRGAALRDGSEGSEIRGDTFKDTVVPVAILSLDVDGNMSLFRPTKTGYIVSELGQISIKDALPRSAVFPSSEVQAETSLTGLATIAQSGDTVTIGKAELGTMETGKQYVLVVRNGVLSAVRPVDAHTDTSTLSSISGFDSLGNPVKVKAAGNEDKILVSTGGEWVLMKRSDIIPAPTVPSNLQTSGSRVATAIPAQITLVGKARVNISGYALMDVGGTRADAVITVNGTERSNVGGQLANQSRTTNMNYSGVFSAGTHTISMLSLDSSDSISSLSITIAWAPAADTEAITDNP
jgi:hypothetical protein